MFFSKIFPVTMSRETRYIQMPPNLLDRCTSHHYMWTKCIKQLSSGDIQGMCRSSLVGKCSQVGVIFIHKVSPAKRCGIFTSIFKYIYTLNLNGRHNNWIGDQTVDDKWWRPSNSQDHKYEEEIAKYPAIHDCCEPIVTSWWASCTVENCECWKFLQKFQELTRVGLAVHLLSFLYQS